MDQIPGASNPIEGDGFTGLSLASFLQLLAQEGKSCTLRLRSNEGRGLFYLWDGELVDAETDNGAVGLTAAYAMLGWREPTMTVEASVDRMRRINLSLTRLLLESAKHHDESPGTARSVPSDDGVLQQSHPQASLLTAALRNRKGVLHYYLIDRRGRIIEQSSHNRQIADLITLCIVNANQAGNILSAKGPQRIILHLDSGESLLIVPGGGGIVGLHLAVGLTANEVLAPLRHLLTSPLIPSGSV
ncbi:MAG: hypothetical protein BWK76_04230 [Desulfobulbaceae bacterium A2]|nr:MAG: hypothetical protein BWK76_04230 [Desulfobulbaceae bacterium A2]